MSEFREEKQCVNVTLHDPHPWGEVDDVFWQCPGLLTEAAVDARAEDVEQLAEDYEELADRVRQRQLRSLKHHFKTAFYAGWKNADNGLEPEFNMWWESFIKDSDRRWQKDKDQGGGYGLTEE